MVHVVYVLQKLLSQAQLMERRGRRLYLWNEVNKTYGTKVIHKTPIICPQHHRSLKPRG